MAPTDMTTVDARVEALGYRLFDADNHYYEALDAFIRYQDPKRRDKGARWVRPKTARPGCSSATDYLGSSAAARSSTPWAGQACSSRESGYGDLIPCPAEFKFRAPRLALMDEQGWRRPCFSPPWR